MNKRNQILFFLFFTIAFLNTSSVAYTQKQMAVNFRGILLTDYEKSFFQTGDILFRKAEGLGSDYILAIDPDSEYSHAGLVYVKDSSIFVIHASPNQVTSIAGVRQVPIDDYLKEIPAAALYRLITEDRNISIRTVDIARRYIDNTPFDYNFSLAEDKALYCTELVWRVYKEAGIELIEKFDFLSLPMIGDGMFILPSTLANSPYLKLIDKFHSTKY